MLEIISFKEVEISSLLLPGDIKERIESERNKVGAESVRTIGLIHEPIVRKHDKRLIVGRDRIARCIIAGKKTVLVKFVECSDEECAIIERIENTERRYDDTEKARLLLELIDIKAKAQEIGESVGARIGAAHKSRTKPKGARRLAREEMAEEQGIKQESVRMAEYRARKKLAGQPRRPVKVDTRRKVADIELVREPAVTELGVPFSDEQNDKLWELKAFIGEACAGLTRFAGSLTQMEKAGYPEPWVKRCRELYAELSTFVRDRRPESQCPYCKSLRGAIETCTACAGLGWVGPMVLRVVSNELLQVDPGRCLVIANGTNYELERFLKLYPQPRQDEDEDLLAPVAPPPIEDEDIW